MSGEEIRRARLILGFTQVELADSLGVSANTVARWERDESPPESPKMLRLALRGLEIDEKRNPKARDEIMRLQKSVARNLKRARKEVEEQEEVSMMK